MSKLKIYSKGDSIGPYEVVRVLAVGGTSTVYEGRPDPARRADLLGMGIDRVAVKVLKPGEDWWARHDSKLLADRIDREFQTLFKLTKLGHPNIVKVYDYGHEEGVPYYVMEYIDGVTLHEAMLQRPRVGQMMNVFGKLCASVAFLHHGGICHRDLKPSNVMVRMEGGDPSLIDFGICFPPGERTLTGPIDLLGTPSYLSPEYAAHWLGSYPDHAYVAAATDDVWALGVILYEILTGGTPWETPFHRREALLREILEVTPRHPCEVYSKAPRALADLAMKMLSRDLAERPANAAAVLDQLGVAAAASDVLGRIAPRRQPKAKQTTWVGAAARRVIPPPHAAPAPAAQEQGKRWSRGLVAVAALGLLCFGLGTFLGRSSLSPTTQATASAAHHCAPADSTPTDTVQGPYVPVVDFGAAFVPTVQRMTLAGTPLPAHPFKDQLRPPCAWPGKEINGGCWREIALEYTDGKKHHCPSEFFELPGGETGWRCFKALVPPDPTAVTPETPKK